MKSNVPFLTPNPQDFKLRIVWSVDASSKLVAEFSSCKWLPRIGETLVLPIDETRKPNWRKFKVFDIVYDFQHQIVRVFCSPANWTPPNAETLMQKIEELEHELSLMDEEPKRLELLPPSAMPKFKTIGDRVEAMEARQKANDLEHQAQLEYELSQINEEDVDEEIAWLKRTLLE